MTEDGVSPMTVPGMPGGMYQTNGLEHDESGRPSAMFVTHERMNAKRYRKLEAIAKKYPLFERFGVSDPGARHPLLGLVRRPGARGQCSG